MPTYKNNLHLGIKDPLVDTDSIADGSITTDKIADGAITEPKLAEAVRKLLHFRELRFLRSWKTQLPPTATEGDYALAPMGNVVYFKEGRWLGEQFDRTILYIDCTKGRFFHYDNGRLIELSTERQLKTINGEPIYGEGNIEISLEGQITIDQELDTESTNPIANAPVAQAISEVDKKASRPCRLCVCNYWLEQITDTSTDLGDDADGVFAYSEEDRTLYERTDSQWAVAEPSEDAFYFDVNGEEVYMWNGFTMTPWKQHAVTPMIELSYIEEYDTDLPTPTGSELRYAYVERGLMLMQWNGTAWEESNIQECYVKFRGKIGLYANHLIDWYWDLSHLVDVDSAISTSSNNPVKNSAIAWKFAEYDEWRNGVDEGLSPLLTFPGMAILPFDGLIDDLDEPYTPQQQSYAGTDGELLVDEANSRVVLKVTYPDETTKYYLSWSANDTRLSNLSYDLSKIFLWRMNNFQFEISRFDPERKRLVSATPYWNAGDYKPTVRHVFTKFSNVGIGDFYYDDGALSLCTAVHVVDGEYVPETLVPVETHLGDIFISTDARGYGYSMGKVWMYGPDGEKELTSNSIETSIAQIVSDAQAMYAALDAKISDVPQNVVVCAAWGAIPLGLTPTKGMYFFNPVGNVLKVYNGTSWEETTKRQYVVYVNAPGAKSYLWNGTAMVQINTTEDASEDDTEPIT
jgi:hypothetical protein